MNLRKFRTSSMIVLGLVTALVVGGCSDGYDSPETAENAAVQGAATNVLVEPATVKSWMDEGLVNSESTFDKKVVILDFGNYSMDPAKDPQRIQGACRVAKADLQSPREEGVGLANPMVATGEQMDAVLQRLGIDEDTTIVFTTTLKDDAGKDFGANYYATRAYWTFRYWGFPQEKLKLLNGGNDAFKAAYSDLMTKEVPEPTPSTYSVRDLEGINTELRASVGEMIEIIKTFDAEEQAILDARGDTFYLAKKPTSAQIVGGTVVVFDGHPEGGEFLGQGSLFTDGKFKSAKEIRDLFKAKGWTPGEKVTVYCTTGYSATPLFFALDAILGGDVQLFDGSWAQLGKYSSNYYEGGQLPLNSPWAIDKYIADLKYWKGTPNPLPIEPLRKAETIPLPFLDASDVPTGNVADAVTVNPAANQVEEADKIAVGNSPTVSITAPSATSTDNVLLSPETLQAWIDDGLVNAATGERVVILDVSSKANYDKGHIPGALHWNTKGQGITRVEGPSSAVNLVLPVEPLDEEGKGESMNKRIKAMGINENTTIVITSSETASYFPSRAYFNFRYYGWPKDRLKVLNGYNFAWDKDKLTKDVPTAAATDLTVQQIASLRDDLRIALPELMLAIRDGVGIPVDMRGDKSAAGSTPGVFDDDHNNDGEATQAGADADYVVFEGTLKDGKAYPFAQFQVDTAKGDYRFKTAEEIAPALQEALGEIPSTDGSMSNPVYSYCRTAYIASTGFFVLDGILDWDVMVYDGSWSQWGSLSDNADKGGDLDPTNPAESAWAVDNTTYMDVTNYNQDNVRKVEPLDPDAEALKLDPASDAANQIENADAAYQAEGGSAGSDGPPTVISAPGGGC